MSQLWWDLNTSAGNNSNPLRPFDSPTWILMSGSTFPLSPTEITTLIQDNWVSEGTVPYVNLIDFSPGTPPPTISGSLLRIFLSGSFNDIPVDESGYSRIKLQLLDISSALFGLTSSIGINIPGPNYGLFIGEFPNQTHSNVAAGPIIINEIETADLSLGVNNISFYFGFTSSSLSRQGLFIDAVTGSPHLSLEPVSVDPLEILPGDIWLRSSSLGRSTTLMVGNQDKSGSIYSSQVLTQRDGETSASLISRFNTNDGPSGSILTVNSIITDNWLTTINSSNSSGSGWRNESWGGGIYMPDSGTVAVWSAPSQSHNFLIPSGSLFVHDTIIVTSGSLILNSGSIISSGSIIVDDGDVIISGSLILSGSASRLNITGSNATAFLRGSPIINVVTGSISASLFSANEGTLYINVSKNPPEITLKISGSWMEFSVTSPNVIDGGYY